MECPHAAAVCRVRLRTISLPRLCGARSAPYEVCVPCVGAILVIALGGRGRGKYKIRPYQETEDTSSENCYKSARHRSSLAPVLAPALARREKEFWAIRRILNQTTKDWHSRSVTLSEAKGLAVRFFAALRMTLLNGCVAKYTNVVHFDLEA